MYKEVSLPVWNEYQETDRQKGSPMKLDRILKRRMKAFLKARRVILDKESDGVA